MDVNELILAFLAAQVAIQAGIFLRLGSQGARIDALWESVFGNKKGAKC